MWSTLFRLSNRLKLVLHSHQIADLPIKNQVFGEITEQPGKTFENSAFDGIFGLGFSSISVSDRKSTPIDRLKSQGTIKKRVFCFHLNSKTAKIGGELIIGGCDVEAKHYVPVTKLGYWQFLLSSIKVIPHNSKRAKIFKACVGGCQAIMDTGTSLITGPRNEITIINDLIGAKLNKATSEYHIDCDAIGLPNIEFDFQGVVITLTPKEYVLKYRVRIKLHI